jgi:hypothetical protein
MFLAVVAREFQYQYFHPLVTTYLIFVTPTALGIVAWKRIMHINLINLDSSHISSVADPCPLDVANLQVGR